MDTKPRQRVRYLRTEDGVQLAWADIGQGPLLIKAANWLSHLEYELESPVWGHWIRFFGEHFRFLRWDERGCGLTDRDVDELSFERWLGSGIVAKHRRRQYAGGDAGCRAAGRSGADREQLRDRRHAGAPRASGGGDLRGNRFAAAKPRQSR